MSGHIPPLGTPVALAGAPRRPERRRFEGHVVSLRPPDPDSDAPSLYAASHGNPETERLWTHMPYGPFEDAGAMQSWMTEQASTTDPLFFVVVENRRHRPAGMVSFLNVSPEMRRLELGHIWLIPELHRTSANTETAHVLLSHAFDDLGYRRVEWKCDALNERSRRAALRLGFAFEGVFRQHMVVKGRNRDTAWYAMLDGDWPRVKRHQLAWLSGRESRSLRELLAPEGSAQSCSRGLLVSQRQRGMQ